MQVRLPLLSTRGKTDFKEPLARLVIRSRARQNKTPASEQALPEKEPVKGCQIQLRQQMAGRLGDYETFFANRLRNAPNIPRPTNPSPIAGGRGTGGGGGSCVLKLAVNPPTRRELQSLLLE